MEYIYSEEEKKLFFFPSGSIELVNKNSFEIFVTRLE